MEQNRLDLAAGSRETIVATHVVDPHNIYVQSANQRAELRKMARDYEDAGSFAQISAHRVTEGEMYLVYVRETRQWRRCRVTAVIRENNRRVFEVDEIDYGSTQTVSVHKLRPLPPSRVHQVPPLAFRCRLANCEPLNGAWTEEDSAFVRNFLGDKRVIMLVRKTILGEPVGVECDLLFNNISLADALASEGRAVIPLQLERPMVHNERPTLCIKSRNKLVGSTEDVIVTVFVDPYSFYVRKKKHESVFRKMCYYLEKYASQQNSVPEPEKGAAYVAHIAGLTLSAKVPGAWARAVVLDAQERGRARVLLPDTGESVWLPRSALRRISSRFTRPAALATECRLYTIIPSQQSWPRATIEFARDLLNTYAPIRVEYVPRPASGEERDGGDAFPVVLWLEHTTYGGALEPNIKAWRSVADLIVEEGLGVPKRYFLNRTETSTELKQND